MRLLLVVKVLIDWALGLTTCKPFSEVHGIKIASIHFVIMCKL